MILKNRINHIALLFIFALTLFFSNIANGNEIKFAILLAPFKNLDRWSKNYSGIDVDIIKEIARRLNLKVTYNEGSWKRCLVMLENGSSDILSSVLKTPEREEYMYFVEPPYITHSPTAFYLKKGKGILYKNTKIYQI